MHFTGFASINFSYATVPISNFLSKRAILGDLANYTKNLVEHRLFYFSGLFN